MRSWGASPPNVVGAVPCHLRYFFRARCLSAPSSVHKQGARRYEEWEPFFRRAPTNKVLDAMMRGRHLCGMAQQRPPAVISQGGRRGAPWHGRQRGRWMRRITRRQRPGRRQWWRGAGGELRASWSRRSPDAPWLAPASLDRTLVVPATRTPPRPRPRMIWWPSALALCAVRWVGQQAVGRPVGARRADVPWYCKASLTQSGSGQESVSHAAVSFMFSGIFVVLWTIQIARI